MELNYYWEPETSRRRLLKTIGAVGLASVAAPGIVAPEDVEDVDAIEPSYWWKIPSHLEPDGTPVYDDGLRFVDYNDVMHGIYLTAAMARDSEMGNEAYRDGRLYAEEMAPRAERWLELFTLLNYAFEESGVVAETVDPDAWEPAGTASLRDLQHAAYGTYHMHHRSGRFMEHGVDLMMNLLYVPLRYASQVPRYVLDEHYDGGRFAHDTDHTAVDFESMAYGFAAAHAIPYGWIVWLREGGHTHIDHWFGYTASETVEIAYEIKAELDAAWDSSRSTYDFGDGYEQPIDAVGAMARAQKVLWELLYMHADDEAAARELFDQSAAMLEAVFDSDVVQPQGLPSHVEFTEDGVVAAADVVDVKRQWEFATHLTGGIAHTRERDGMAMFIDEVRPELGEKLGETTDTLLHGVPDYQLDDDGRIVGELDFETGDVTDDRIHAATVGSFILGIGNCYRAGSDFERPGNFDEDVDEEMRDRSIALYDIQLENTKLLEEAFLLE